MHSMDYMKVLMNCHHTDYITIYATPNCNVAETTENHFNNLVLLQQSSNDEDSYVKQKASSLYERLPTLLPGLRSHPP